MKTKRIIWGAFCAIVIATLSACVYVQWSAQGCDAYSLFAGCGVYCFCGAAVWLVVDAAIRKE